MGIVKRKLYDYHIFRDKGDYVLLESSFSNIAEPFQSKESATKAAMEADKAYSFETSILITRRIEAFSINKRKPVNLNYRFWPPK